MTLTRAQIDQIAQKLKGMPAAPSASVNITKQEAVKLLAKEIASLQRRGYTLEQIAESLKHEGLDLSTATLKVYLSRANAPKRPRRSTPPIAPPPAGRETPAIAKQTAPLTKDTPPKGGKDAFLVKDKDHY